MSMGIYWSRGATRSSEAWGWSRTSWPRRSFIRFISDMKENSTKKEFLVPSDLSEVQRVSSEALSFLKPLALRQAVLFDIRLCLDEALINAIKYGHQFKRELTVRLSIEYDQNEVRMLVEDQGEGFDP